METELNNIEVLFNKLNYYFKDNIRNSLTANEMLIIITKEDLFYCIDIPSFIINDDHSVDLMIIEDLCFKQIKDLYMYYDFPGPKYFFAHNDNEYTIYYYDIEYGVMKEYISEQKIIDMCCGYRHSISLTQSGKVYEYEVNIFERVNSEK
jgi:hypothetical protein